MVAVAPRTDAQERAAPLRPFMKWVGGKRRVVPHLLGHVARPLGRYFEPFVGGGAFFWALADEPAQRQREDNWAVITDVNHRLVRTYKGIRDDVDGVAQRLALLRDGHCKEQYYDVRATDVDAHRHDADVAAWMIYLNRTGFNGLYRVNKKGGFNVPIGNYTNPLILDGPTLRACSKALETVEIAHGHYQDVFFKAQAGDTVYFDPPYVPISSTASFTSYTRDGFGPEDQIALRDLAWELKRRGVQVILSNHDVPEVRELYADFDIKQILVGRAINSKASKRGRVAEVIIT